MTVSVFFYILSIKHSVGVIILEQLDRGMLPFQKVRGNFQPLNIHTHASI